MENPEILIYTDGSSRGNPGPGGYGIIIQQFSDKRSKEFSQGFRKTTNNRMELTAAINCIKVFKSKENIEIFTDSKYLKDGIEKWINNCKKNNWKTASKKSVKNKDLWIELDDIIQKHEINWNWVKGHANNKYNELADSLARKYIEENN